jgi:SNF2 family DNA or RNA helicase
MGEARGMGFDNIHVYHGPAREENETFRMMQGQHLLVLTTFEIVRIEFQNKRFLHGMEWGRVVLDEAHRICEQTSKTSRAIHKLRSRNRWCMTGTPFKNGISDLMALSRFLMVGPYCNANWWRMFGNNPTKLREWRDRFLHMRDKSGLVDLPPLEIHNIQVTLPPREREIYRSLGSATWKLREGEECEAPPNSNTDQGELIRILRQRQATNHPLLVSSAMSAKRVMVGSPPGECVGCEELGVKRCGDHHLCGSCGEEPLCVGCVAHDLGKGSNWVHSAKTRALWEYLRDTAHVLTSPTKIVLFSQWTSCLDLLGHMLAVMGVEFACYDGRVNSTEDREGVISKFKNDPQCKILLTSLGAGGEGVNLVFASHVVLMEPYWNMAVEQQAIDRLHRIGQTSTTHVARFVVEDTIEEWVRNIQTKKTNELKRVLFGDDSKTPVKRCSNEVKTLGGQCANMQSLDVFMKPPPSKRIKLN